MTADIVRLISSGPPDLPSKTTVAAEIRSRITTGRLALGARISDKQLAAELDVSRTPVREALVQLQSEGLVVMRPQSGTFVVDLTIEDVRQICATRAILEAGALRLAAETGSADPIGASRPPGRTGGDRARRRQSRAVRRARLPVPRRDRGSERQRLPHPSLSRNLRQAQGAASSAAARAGSHGTGDRPAQAHHRPLGGRPTGSGD